MIVYRILVTQFLLVTLIVLSFFAQSKTKTENLNSQSEKQRTIILEQPEAMSLVIKAGQLLDKGKLAEAISACNKAISISPDLALAYSTRSFAYGKLQQFEKALKDADYAIKIDSDEPMGYSSRAFALYGAGESQNSKLKIQEALENFSKALNLDPKIADDYLNRGKCYVFLEQLKEAHQDFSTAIKLNPELAEAYHWRGTTFNKLGQPDLAAADLNKAKLLGYPTK